jgi:hypothetical protein
MTTPSATPSGSSPTHPRQQHAGVPADDHSHRQRAGHDHGPAVPDHAPDDRQRAGVEDAQPRRLPATAAVLRQPEQGVGEVPAPDQDGVAHRTQQQQVHQQPRGHRAGDADQADDHDSGQPGSHHRARTQMPGGPPHVRTRAVGASRRSRLKAGVGGAAGRAARRERASPDLTGRQRIGLGVGAGFFPRTSV